MRVPGLMRCRGVAPPKRVDELFVLRRPLKHGGVGGQAREQRARSTDARGTRGACLGNGRCTACAVAGGATVSAGADDTGDTNWRVNEELTACSHGMHRDSRLTILPLGARGGDVPEARHLTCPSGPGRYIPGGTSPSHMKTTTRFLLCAALAFAAPLMAQQAAPSIAVTGSVSQPLTLTAADLATMPRQSVTTTSNGIATTYEGVWLSDVLKKAGVAFESGMRGAALSTYVIASASDGYQVVFSAGELDPDMTDGQFLLADKANGKTLFGENGSFRLVVPKDKRGARSIRMLTSLNVVQLKKGTTPVRM